MRILGLVLFAVVAVLALLFAVLNAEPVQLNYYFDKTQLPLSLTLVAALMVGALLGVLASLSVILKLKRANARLRKEVRNTEKEVMNLRNLPIKDTH